MFLAFYTSISVTLPGNALSWSKWIKVGLISRHLGKRQRKFIFFLSVPDLLNELPNVEEKEELRVRECKVSAIGSESHPP